jgi:hypothetical protein
MNNDNTLTLEDILTAISSSRLSLGTPVGILTKDGTTIHGVQAVYLATGSGKPCIVFDTSPLDVSDSYETLRELL